MLSEMLNNLFDGPIVTLEDMLNAREQRQFKQHDLFQRFSGAVVLSVTMNIPGDVKISSVLKELFESFVIRISDTMRDVQVLFETLQHLKTGSEYYAVVQLPAMVLKERMIALESNSAIGRLMDIDIVTRDEKGIAPLSRQDLGYPRRLCYVCGEDAKSCGRSRKHTIEQMRLAIMQLLQE